MTAKFENRAEVVADKLRAFSQKVDALAWDLDAALSAVNKDAVGYRVGTKANPTGGPNSLPGELEAALVKAEAFLMALGDAVEAVGLGIQAFSVGGTYGRFYAASLEGLDAARSAARSLQLAGDPAPLRVVYDRGDLEPVRTATHVRL